MCILRDLQQASVFTNIPTDLTPINTNSIALKLGLDKDTLFRCLRFISSFGYTVQIKDRLFKHSPKSIVLADQNSYETAELRHEYNPEKLALLSDFSKCLQDGGMSFFQYLHMVFTK